MLNYYCKERDRLISILERLNKCAYALSYADKKIQQDYMRLTEKANKPFYVLLAGGIHVGKTSMINALIGEALFPASWKDSTISIIELQYGPKKVVFYPRKRKQADNIGPISIVDPTVETLFRYLTMDNIEEEQDAQKQYVQLVGMEFEKIIINWPLAFLENGIVLVDSPGVYNTKDMQFLAEQYVTKADVLLYVMDVQGAFSRVDKELLSYINALGMNRIMVGYTHIDQIERCTAPDSIEKIKKLLYQKVTPFTRFGQNGVYYLDSVTALRLKEKNDLQGLAKSGYSEFEKCLDTILFENVGKNRLEELQCYCWYYAEQLERAAFICKSVSLKNNLEVYKAVDASRKIVSDLRNEVVKTKRQLRAISDEMRCQLEITIDDLMHTCVDETDLEGFEAENRLPRLARLNTTALRGFIKKVVDDYALEYAARLNRKRLELIIGRVCQEIIVFENRFMDAFRSMDYRIADSSANIAEVFTGIRVMRQGYMPYFSKHCGKQTDLIGRSFEIVNNLNIEEDFELPEIVRIRVMQVITDPINPIPLNYQTIEKFNCKILQIFREEVLARDIHLEMGRVLKSKVNDYFYHLLDKGVDLLYKEIEWEERLTELLLKDYNRGENEKINNHPSYEIVYKHIRDLMKEINNMC